MQYWDVQVVRQKIKLTIAVEYSSLSVVKNIT